MTVPSSPALASMSPEGEKRTQLTTPECLDKVARYSTLGGWGDGLGRPAPVALAIAAGDGMLGLTSHMRTLLSPPAVANLQFCPPAMSTGAFTFSLLLEEDGSRPASLAKVLSGARPAAAKACPIRSERKI